MKNNHKSSRVCVLLLGILLLCTNCCNAAPITGIGVLFPGVLLLLLVGQQLRERVGINLSYDIYISGSAIRC